MEKEEPQEPEMSPEVELKDATPKMRRREEQAETPPFSRGERAKGARSEPRKLSGRILAQNSCPGSESSSTFPRT